MKLQDPDFDKRNYFRSLESIVYLFLILPLVGFGWVFLEKEKTGELRAVFFEEPDFMFHGAMAIAVGYVLLRTLGTWSRDMRKAVEPFQEIDVKLSMLKKPIIYRNIMWAFGAGIGAFGLYEKGDMVYAIVFTVFLILMTANRPSGYYFAKLLRLKKEDKEWLIK